MDDKNQSENADLNTLETQDTSSKLDGGTSATPPPKKKKKKFSIMGVVSHLNIYLLFFILVVVVAAGIVYVGYQRDQEESEREQAETERLTPEELQELAQSDTRIGDPQQLLTVESNTIFTGQVLVRDNLDVAGQISVGGSLSLPGITVSGTSNFEEIQAESLAIGGDTNIQGQLTVDGGISVGGGGSFGGNLSAPLVTAGQLQLDGDLQVTRHIDTGGPSPSVSSGGSIGSGGTVSISGSDTAGTVTINPGGSAGNGPIANITFANAFNQTPHIVVTPVGRSVSFFITRTTTGFTIHAAQGLTSGSFAFDYHAFD